MVGGWTPHRLNGRTQDQPFHGSIAVDRGRTPHDARESRDFQLARNGGASSSPRRVAFTSWDASGDGVSVPSVAAMGVRVSVVIPTLNEAENLPHVFARLPGACTR